MRVMTMGGLDVAQELDDLYTQVASLETALIHAHYVVFGPGPHPDPIAIIGKLEQEIRQLSDRRRRSGE